MEFYQKRSRVECGWAMVKVSEGCLLRVCFALVQFDGIWEQAEMWAAGMVGMRRLARIKQGWSHAISEGQLEYISWCMNKIKAVQSWITSEGRQEEIFISLILVMFFFTNSYCNVQCGDLKVHEMGGIAKFYQTWVYCGGGRGRTSGVPNPWSLSQG